MTALKKILYVEDDEDIAEIAVMTLEELGGFEVKHCASGMIALDQLSSYAPQLILMDVMMPGMDGPETFERIKETSSAHVPVIFMTAKAQKHEQEEYINMGAVGVIVKPFDAMTLCSTITQLWEGANER